MGRASVPRLPPSLPASTPAGWPSPWAAPAGLPAQLLSWPLPRAGVTGVYPASSPLLLFLSVAFKERLVCATAAAPGPGRPSSRLSRWGACSPVPPWGLARARQGKRGWARGGGRHSVPNTEPGGAREAPGLEGSVRLARALQRPLPPGPGLWPVETFGAGTPVLQAFGANAIAKPAECAGCCHTAVHTGAHMPDTRAHAQAHVHTVGQVFPTRAAGHLHLASCGFRLGGGAASTGPQGLETRLPAAPWAAPLPQPPYPLTLWALRGCLQPALSPAGCCAPGPVGGGGQGEAPRDSSAFSGFFKLGTCRVGRARLPGARGGCFWSL